MSDANIILKLNILQGISALKLLNVNAQKIIGMRLNLFNFAAWCNRCMQHYIPPIQLKETFILNIILRCIITLVDKVSHHCGT